MAVNILIVDDVKTNLIYLDALLEELEGADKISILEANSGKEALEISKNNDIHLIISDIQMPEMDGFELAMHLKEDTKTKSIPVIFLTAEFKSEEFVKNGYELGAIDYFTKPVEKYQFLNKIRLYLDFLTKNKELEEYKKALSEASIVSKSDLNGLITYANNKFSEISGYTHNELIGRPYSIIKSDNTQQEVFADMWKTIESKKTWQGVIENQAKNGSIYFLNTSITPILNTRDEITEYISIGEDITDLKKLQFDELNSSVDKALDIHLNEIVDMLPIPTVVVNENSEVEASNEMFNNCYNSNNGNRLDKLFIEKEGYISSDDIFDWKDVVASSNDSEKVLINVLGEEKEFNIKIKKIESKNLYTVCLYPVKELL